MSVCTSRVGEREIREGQAGPGNVVDDDVRTLEAACTTAGVGSGECQVDVETKACGSPTDQILGVLGPRLDRGGLPADVSDRQGGRDDAVEDIECHVTD